MDRKNLIALIAGCLAVLLLICILLVGILDNIWPWDGVTAYGRLITGRTQAGIDPKETTVATEEPTDAQPGGAQQSEVQTPQTPTVGEIGQETLPPTLPNEEDDIKTEVGGVVIPPQNSASGSTDSTESTDGTDSTEDSTKPTDEKADKELDASLIPGW